MAHDWRLSLVHTKAKGGGLAKLLSNVVTIIDRDPSHGLKLRELEGGLGRIVNGTKNIEALEDLVPHLQRWLTGPTYDLEVHHDLILRAIPVVARRHRYAPVRDYLTGLRWDGRNRLDTWLSVYGGCEDHELTRRIGAWWMQQAAARGMKPGCKADYCLIIEGEQGLRKSTLLRTLVPREEWYTDGVQSLQTRDDKLVMSGKWIIELAELAPLGDRVDHLKAALTRQVDVVRPLYERHTGEFPRMSVFAGTTNQGQYLQDETGGRRFWPVKMVRSPDLTSLARDRDQLWAEAVDRERRGVQRWPERGDSVLAAAQEERRAELPWESELSEYLVGRGDFVTTTQLLNKLQIASDRQNQSTLKALSTVMRALGWEPHRSASSRGYRRIT